MLVAVSIAFHEGYEAGYWNQPGNPYPTDSIDWHDFDAGYDWGRHGARLPGRKSGDHFKLGQSLVYTLIAIHGRRLAVN
jgi:hypothetical protein